jgi:hypothetical protein
LQLDQAIKVGDLPLPAGAKLLSDPAGIVVQCVLPLEIPEEAPAAPAESAEPEIIGRKPGEEEEEEGG